MARERTRYIVRFIRSARPSPVLMGLLVTSVISCAGSVFDIEKSLKVSEVTTGWFDTGIVQGNLNRLVPTLAFQLENITDTEISSVQVLAVFRRSGEHEEWGSVFARVIGAEGLPSGAMSQSIVLRSDLGYTGEQPRLEMFENRLFVDVNVELSLKYRGEQWVKITDFLIERQLLTE